MSDQLQIVAVDGTVTVLSDLVDGIDIQEGASGRFAPPVALTADDVAGRDGARLRQVRADVRDIVLPIAVEGADRQQLTERIRSLVSSVWPTQGDALLRWVRADNTSRQIRVRYAGGLDVVDDPARAEVGLALTGLVLRAFDPYWEDVVPDIRVAEVAVLAFLSPDVQTAWFAWQTVDVDVQGGFQVVNDGDDVAYPRWTVQGPGGPVRLVNSASGELIEVDTVLTAGQQLHVDTRPDFKTVTGPAGNLWPDVTDESTLWPIVRGTQQIQVQIEDAVPGETNVRLEWRRRWLST